jgi:iron complex outermembrane receptor protein
MRQPLARNVDATIAGAEAGLGYQFTDHFQADLSTMYAWEKILRIIAHYHKLHL